VPGWHEATKDWQEAGDVRMVGIIQEQHPDRARLFMQWKRMDWPILVDSLDLLETTLVPRTLLIDEHGIIREIQPDRDDLDRVRQEFVDVDFEPPAAAFEPERIEPSRAERRFLDVDIADMGVTGAGTDAGGTGLDAVIQAFVQEVSADPDAGYTLFRAGVAHRARYDSPDRQPGDFQQAVAHWERALDIDPNNYIFRRRIQQYGPRLDKPYPFYDWVSRAREEIEARGEEPVPLVVEPGGAEFAHPSRDFATETTPPEPPERHDRLFRDDGRFVQAETTVVPLAIAPGGSTRAHVTFVPNDAIEAHWNNEVDDLALWVRPPEGWQASQRRVTVPNPRETVSREPRKVELEIQAPADAEPGTAEIPGYALYYVCEDVNGICLYRRQDVTFRVQVEG